MSKREKTILDRIGAIIPGFDGYSNREDQRKSDQLLRSHIAATLQVVQTNLEVSMKMFVKEGLMNELTEFEEGRKACSIISDKIRYASYGASSLFDEEQIKEDELTKIYSLDELMLDKANHLNMIVQQDLQPSLLIAAVRNHLKDMDQLYSQRSQFILLNGKM